MASPELLREAEADLIARLIRGILPYLILMLIMAVTTDYRSAHALFFWGFTAALVVSIGIRAALARLQERVHMLRPGFRKAALPPRWDCLPSRRVWFTPALSGFMALRVSPT